MLVKQPLFPRYTEVGVVLGNCYTANESIIKLSEEFNSIFKLIKAQEGQKKHILNWNLETNYNTCHLCFFC